MKVTKENVIAQVENSPSSIFTKEDVLFLINSLEVGSSRKILVSDIERAIDQTISWLENSREVVDLENAEFEIEWGNKIACTEVPINFDEIREALENNFMDFGEAEVEDEVVGSEFVPVDEERDDE